MSSHLNNLCFRRLSRSISILRIVTKVIKLNGDDRSSFWVFDLESFLCICELQPMITVKLGDQITLLVNESEFLCISREHNFRDVHFETLSFVTNIIKSIEKNVANSSFSATNDGFFTILIHIEGLVIHHNLLFELQISFAEDQNLAFASHKDVLGRTDSREDFD